MPISRTRIDHRLVPHHVYERVVPEAVGTRWKLLSPLTSFALAGLLTGLAELVALVLWHRIGESNTFGTLQLNRHFPWMIPISHAVLFAFVSPLFVLAKRLGWSLVARLERPAILFLSCFSLLLMIPGMYTVAVAFLAAGLAHRIDRRMGATCYQKPRLKLAVGLAALAIVGGLAGQRFHQELLAEGRALAALPAARAGAPNVLLIVLDTVAAEHLSLHGYHRATSPNLERLAARGVVFREARAPSPWTLPSHATLLTGEWPHKLDVGVNQPLDDRTPALAERLQDYGYATSGFIANTYFCNSWFGLGRGFLRYDDDYDNSALVAPIEAVRCSALGRVLLRNFGGNLGLRAETVNLRKSAEKINQDFLGWLDQHEGPPFFTFLNYFDAHDPYILADDATHRHAPASTDPHDQEALASWHHAIQTCGRTGRMESDERTLQVARDAYDECLTYLDERLGALFAELEKRGVLDDTIIVLTADHGEAFGEHGYLGHSMTLHREETHVPLIVFGPSGGVPEGVSVERPVSLRDVPATILDLVAPASARDLPGHSLAATWNSATHGEVGISPVLSSVSIVPAGVVDTPPPGRAPALCGPLASIVVDNHLFIRYSFGGEELFDLAADHYEKVNLAQSEAHAAILARCREVMTEVMAGDR